MALATGANEITITASQNGITSPTYTVTVTRASTTVSIAGGASSATYRLEDVDFTVTRAEISGQALDVDLTISQDQSFLAASKLTPTVTIPANKASATLTLQPTDFSSSVSADGRLTATVQDGDEFDLGSAASASVDFVVADPAVIVRLQQSSYSFLENAGTVTVNVVAETAAGVPQPTSLSIGPLLARVASGTAVSGGDYTFQNTNVILQASDYVASGGRFVATRALSLPLINDTTSEGDETLSIILQSLGQLPNLVDLTQADGSPCPGRQCSSQVTIIDDDSPPAQVTDVRVTSSQSALVVNWGAVAAADGYKVQWKSGAQTFADAATDSREAIISSGSTTSYSISGLTDGTLYTVRVIATRSGAPSDGAASSEVTGTPGMPTLTIADASATEGSAVEFTVTLSPAAATDVTVGYATTDGTATSDSSDSDGADFTAPASGAELTIGAGATSATISIATGDDSVDEEDETFTVTLSSPSSNAALGTAKTATGTIENDDESAAAISSIQFSNAPASGVYGLGDVIELSVTFDAAVDVTGSPRIALQLTGAPAAERYAVYDGSASSATVLVFRKMLSAALDDSDGISVAANALELNGGGIVNDGATVAAVLDHNAVTGGNIRTRVISGVAITSTPSVATPAGYYGAGETIQFTVSFSQAVTVDTNSGTPALLFSASDGARQEAAYASGSGSTALVFNWTVPADVPGAEAPIEIPGNAGSGGTLLTDGGLVLKGGAIQDSSARSVNIRHGNYATSSEADTTAPALVAGAEGATVNGTELVLTFERKAGVAEHLDENSVPAATDFAVWVRSVARAVSNVAVDGAMLTLTLSDPVGHAQTVSLTYTPGANPIKDLWGNDAPGASSRAVRNDSPEPVLSVADLIVSEGDGMAVFAVMLDVVSGEALTVDYATSDGTALAGSDYTAKSGALSIAKGQTQMNVEVALTDDSLSEGAEDFTFTLSNPSNASIGDGQASATINDNEGTPTLSIADARATEGSAVEFTVTLDPVAAAAVTVGYSTADGTATSESSDPDGADYTAPTSGAELTISAEQTSATISIATGNDTVDEDDETFTLTLSSPSSNAALGADKTATGTIEDDDTDPAVITNLRFTNTPADGIYNFREVIEVSVTFDQDVEVTGTPQIKITQLIGHYHFIYADYDAAASTDRVLVFRLRVTGAIDDSSNGLRIGADSLQLNGGSIRNKGTTVGADRSHALVISDLDVSTRTINGMAITSSPSVASPAGFYGPGETVAFTVTFSRSVKVKTDSGVPALFFSASDSGLQQAAYASGSESSSLVFAWTVPADVPGAEDTIEIPTNIGSGVTLLTDAGLALNGGIIQALGSDVNIRHGQYTTSSEADTTGPALAAGAGGATVNGTELELTFERKAGVAEHLDETSVPAASDFSVLVQSAARGVSGVAVDGATVTLTLSDPVGHAQTVTLGYTPGTDPLKDLWGNNAPGISARALRNDSPEPELSIADVAVNEGDGTVEFTVTLDQASGATVTVNYATSDGTAEAGSDYTAKSGTLSFAPGETSKTIEVSVTDDSLGEEDEDFKVTLSNASNATTGDDEAEATITDNETPTLTIADATATEGASMSFTVTLDPVAAADVTVAYATTDGTATADSNHEDGADYTAPASAALLTISTGQSTGTITIATGNDTVYEADETFTVTLSSPSSNAVLGTNRAATGTIENEDTASTDAALKSLAITAGGSSVELTPTFAAGTYSYAGDIENTTTSVTVTTETNHGKAAVAIEGDDDSASPNQADLDMAFGENEFTVTVTAEDGLTDREYEITLTRAPPEVAWKETAYSIQEDSGDVELTVTRTPASDDTVTVDYATVDNGEAVGGEDYTATSGTVTFAPGETEKTITVTILDDTLYEPNGAGNFSVALSNLTGTAEFEGGEVSPLALLYMSGGAFPSLPGENDLPPTASMANIDVDEDAGTLAFTLELSHGIEANIAYSTTSSRVSGTAAAGSDYEAFFSFGSAQIPIPARQTSATFEVMLIDDDVDEDDETLIIPWTRLGAFTATPSVEATGTIRDNDTRGVTVSETELEIDEGDDGTYTVVLTSEPTADVAVTPSRGSGDTDVTVSGVLTFTALNWNLAQTVTVSAGSDDDALDDTATIEHAVSGADYGANSVTANDVAVTVDDDELPPTLELNLDAIAGDDKVSIAEKAAGFTITGDTGSEGGVSVTVTVDTTELTATSAEADPATWSVSVPTDATYITGASLDVEVNATKTGFTAPATITRPLTVDLTAPTAPTYTAPASLKVGVPITEMSPSGGVGIDEYAVTGLPSGLNLDTGTGAIGGTPDTADANTADVTVTVSDAAGNTAEVPITFPAVAKGDQTLTGFQYSASSVTFGSAAPTVTAPGGVETTVSYLATPLTVCTVEPTSGALTLEGVGSCVITATAAGTDHYNEATATFTVAVQAVGTLSLNLDAIVTDNKVNIAEKAAGFTITGDTGTESGVSVTVEIGTATLPATSADDSGTATWSVSVAADASYISGTSVDVEVNATKTGFTAPAAVERTLAVDLTAPTAPTYTAPASLKVGVPITEMSPSGGVGIDEYAVTGLPSGLNLDTGTGAIGGTPDTADANTASATVTVSDAAGNTVEVPITFPAVTKGDQTLTGFQYSASSVAFGSAAPTVTAPGGVETTLSYSATPASVCSVDASGALTLEGAGECVITATAAGTDDYNEATADFTLTVQAVGALAVTLDAIAGDDTVNIAEKAAGFTISGNTGSEGGVSVTVTVDTTELTTTSADTDPATWSVSVPADATYITGTSLDVEVNATKTGFTAPAAITRTLTVDLTAPTAPTYTAPGTLKVGEAIAVMNPSGGIGIDEYSATGLPSGLNLDTGTGAIGGTPDTADANTASATVTVSDAAGNTVEVPITFPAVTKGDQTLTGFQYSASSVTFGSAAPTVTAPGGVETTLSYSATPASVCSVDASGALTLEGAGECVITATAAGTDDYNEATADFTLTVQAVGALAVTIDAIAGDDTVNIAEKAAGFSISGNTGSEGGVSVTVTVDTTELTTTSADTDPATWSVSVAADATYITGTSVDVTVSATKTGFTAPGDVQRTLTVDLTAPTAPTYTAPGTLKVGEAIAEMSPSGGVGIDEYAVTGLPSGLSLDTGTGAIGGTPDTADANTAERHGDGERCGGQHR